MLVIVVGVKLREPVQATESDEDTPVADSVAQFSGLDAKDPLSVPPVMLTDGLVVVQPESVPVTSEGFVPPPLRVSAGENDTVTDRAQVTPPAAAADNAAGPAARTAVAGAVATVATPATTTIGHNTRRRRDRKSVV